jgi:hypothetical protein
MGYNLCHFSQTATGLYVVCSHRVYLIVARGRPSTVLFESEDRDTVNWIDFTLELVVGTIGLALGLTIGRRGYKTLKPLITRLWSYPAFQERVRAIGQHAQRGDALATGWALAELWRYLWSSHRQDLIAGIWAAVRQEFTFGALLLALVRWTARVISGGIAFFVELGAVALPLGDKLRR